MWAGVTLRTVLQWGVGWKVHCRRMNHTVDGEKTTIKALESEPAAVRDQVTGYVTAVYGHVR